MDTPDVDNPKRNAADRLRGLAWAVGVFALGFVIIGFGFWRLGDRESVQRFGPDDAAVQSVARTLAEDAPASNGMLAVEWRDTRGRLNVATVDRLALKAFALSRVEQAARERAVLRETGVRYLRYRLVPVFDRMKRRVTTYTTWMYGWAASYVKAYMLVGRGVWKSLGMVAEGNTETLAQDLEADLTEFVMEEFRETVLKPAESDAEIRQAWDDTIVFVGSEWRRLRGETKLEFLTFLEDQGARASVITQAVVARGDAAAPAFGAAASEPPPDILVGSPTDTALGEETVVDGIIARSVRPWLSRVVGITLQSTAAGTAAAAGGAALPVAGPGVGLVLGVTTFLAYHWAFDFIVNEVDEGLNRKGIESSLKAAIDDGKVAVDESLSAALTRRLDAAHAAATSELSKDQVSLGVGLVVRIRTAAAL